MLCDGLEWVFCIVGFLVSCVCVPKTIGKDKYQCIYLALLTMLCPSPCELHIRLLSPRLEV